MTIIEILGTGCPKCEKLAHNAETAAKKLGIEYTIEKVTDISEIMGYGVMITPALVIDGKVLSSGSIPSSDDISKMLAKNEDEPSRGPKKGGCCCGGAC